MHGFKHGTSDFSILSRTKGMRAIISKRMTSFTPFHLSPFTFHLYFFVSFERDNPSPVPHIKFHSICTFFATPSHGFAAMDDIFRSSLKLVSYCMASYSWVGMPIGKITSPFSLAYCLRKALPSDLQATPCTR